MHDRQTLERYIYTRVPTGEPEHAIYLWFMPPLTRQHSLVLKPYPPSEKKSKRFASLTPFRFRRSQ